MIMQVSALGGAYVSPAPPCPPCTLYTLKDLQASKLGGPVYQLMASGMTNSTAHPADPCEGTYREDLLGLR